MKKNEKQLENLAGFFKVMGDVTRLRIIEFLSRGENHVTAIAGGLNMEQSAISHQLRVLKAARLVRSRREGKSMYYALDDNHVIQIFLQGLEHVKEQR